MSWIKTILLLQVTLVQIATGQSIGTFSSVEPKVQDQLLNIPSSHSFQLLLQSGQTLADNSVLGDNLDFTSYVPLNGSSTEGYMTVSSETNPAAVAVFNVSYSQGTGSWTCTNSSNIDFSGMGLVAGFCSGGVMPWGTVIVAEEIIPNADNNTDGYEDVGWLIELNPANRTIVSQDGSGGNGKDKIWAAGRTTHENICVHTDQKTFYFGADNPTNGFLYKFVSNTAQRLASGDLYVLRTRNGELNQTIGEWVKIPNTTQAQRNNTHFIAKDSNATNFDGVEDVEVGPDGKIYFAAKGPGRVYRFTDNGTVGTPNDVAFEIFVENKPYDVDGSGPYAPENWGVGNDNLAFDGEGNLWVLQDGDRNHIWVVGPGHIPGGDNEVRLFATTPLGAEPTGINFTPDYKFMFLSFQHPNNGNATAQLDAVGQNIVFNTHSTIAIGLKENLGQPIIVTSNLLPASWNISPNPADAEITLSSSEQYSDITIRIIDAGGKVLREERFRQASKFSMPIHELKPGSYQLQVSGKKVTGILKFVKR